MTNTLMDRIWQGFHITLPTYPAFSQDTTQLYPKSIFGEMKIGNNSWNELYDMMEEFTKPRNKYIGYNLGNGCFKLARGKRFFSFHLSKDYNFSTKTPSNTGSFFLWSEDGCSALGGIVIEDFSASPSDNFINWINETTLNWVNNKLHCSDCGKLITKEEIAGSYFAGKYCKDCWEKTWKAIEAKETYN